MSGIDGKVVAITGASSGIGEATALLLAERGAVVVLGARRSEQLDEVARKIRESSGALSPVRSTLAAARTSCGSLPAP